jgi:gas vesicle protein
LVLASAIAAAPVAEESVQHYLELYHKWFDPPIETSVYVFQEAAGALVRGGQLGVRSAADAGQWLYEQRGDLGRFVVVTYNQTAEEARELWEAHADEVGNAVVIVADEASDAMKDFYAAGTKTVSNLVIVYAENEEEIHKMVGAVKGRVESGVVYAVEKGGELGEAAVGRAVDYYDANKDEFAEELTGAYVWTEERLVEVSDMAKEKWIPSGIAAMEEARDYLEAHQDEFYGSYELVTAAIEDGYGEMVTGMDRLWENHQNKVIALGLYAQEKGTEAGRYLKSHGDDAYEAVARATNRSYQWGKETVAEYYQDLETMARETDWEQTVSESAGFVRDRMKQLNEMTGMRLVDDETVLNSVSELSAQAADSAERAWERVSEQSDGWGEQAARTANEWAEEAAEWSESAVQGVEVERAERAVRQAAEKAGRAFGETVDRATESIQGRASRAVESTSRDVQRRATETWERTSRDVQRRASDAANSVNRAIDGFFGN